MTEHITPDQLRQRTKGSLGAHESLLEAVRVRFALAGLEGFPIYTGGIPKYLPGGELVLRKNPHQIGIADMIVPFRDVVFVGTSAVIVGRLGLLEMKTGNARRSPGQVRTETLFKSYGFLCVLVRNVEDVDPIIETDRNARRFMCHS